MRIRAAKNFFNILILLVMLNSHALWSQAPKPPDDTYGVGLTLSPASYSSFTYSQSFTPDTFFVGYLGMGTFVGSHFIAGDFLFDDVDPFGFAGKSNVLRPYTGIGMFTQGGEDYRSIAGVSDSRASIGTRAILGVRHYFSEYHFEVSGQLVPAVVLEPKVQGSFQIDLGIRYYFNFH